MTAPIIAGLPGDTFQITPTAESAERAYFATRADRALHGTLTGESMATWGPRYTREARAQLALNQRPGQLWERISG